ncbi:MAG: 4-(cytidine 5'-diphospho)-2-C-methyl-D-erythritol kinase [Gaiellaceae bacterium]
MQPTPPRAPATAKLNLALVVGPPCRDGRHQVVTVLQRLSLADRVSVAPGVGLTVTGFPGDTIVRLALKRLAVAVGVEPRWHAHLVKSIPVAAGLGGGSSDAATALRLANATLSDPLDDDALRGLAATVGADVPFFLTAGPQLGEDDGTRLTPLTLPTDYWVVLLLPRGSRKTSTRAVYEAFDRRGGQEGFEERRHALLGGLVSVRHQRELAALPANDLAESPLAAELLSLGAFRADVTGAGPTVYGLFLHRADAERARRRLEARGRTWMTVPAWYG